MRSLRKWLLRSTSERVERHSGDADVVMLSPELRQAIGEKVQELTSELRLASAIDAATIIERNATGDPDNLEPNVYITSPTLRTFKFSPESAERRIRLVFPGLSDEVVEESIRHLADRVVLSLSSKTIPADEPISSWVYGWADYDDPFTRLYR